MHFRSFHGVLRGLWGDAGGLRGVLRDFRCRSRGSKVFHGIHGVSRRFEMSHGRFMESQVV